MAYLFSIWCEAVEVRKQTGAMNQDRGATLILLLQANETKFSEITTRNKSGSAERAHGAPFPWLRWSYPDRFTYWRIDKLSYLFRSRQRGNKFPGTPPWDSASSSSRCTLPLCHDLNFSRATMRSRVEVGR